MQNYFKNEIHDVLSGKSPVRFGSIIQTITSYLSDGEETSSKIKEGKQLKAQEEKRLEAYISANNLWIEDIDFSQYISEGAEQKVYLRWVLKIGLLNLDSKKITEPILRFAQIL